MRRCQVHDGANTGIYVRNQGKGTFEKCETFANKTCGLHIGTDGHPVVRRCTFRDGEKHG